MYWMERFSEQKTWPGRGLWVGICLQEERESKHVSETCREERAGKGGTTPLQQAGGVH